MAAETLKQKKAKLDEAQKAVADRELELDKQEADLKDRETALQKAIEAFALQEKDVKEEVVEEVVSTEIPLHVLNAMAKRSDRE